MFKCIKNSHLILSPKRYSFLSREVCFLGHIISAAGAMTDNPKVNKIKGYPVSKYEAKLISFLGFCRMYRKILRDGIYKYELMKKLMPSIQKIIWNYLYENKTQSNIIWNYQTLVDTYSSHLIKVILMLALRKLMKSWRIRFNRKFDKSKLILNGVEESNKNVY